MTESVQFIMIGFFMLGVLLGFFIGRWEADEDIKGQVDTTFDRVEERIRGIR